MLILLKDLLEKIGWKKGKLLRFLHRVGVKLEPNMARGLVALSLFCINHYSFLKIHKLKIINCNFLSVLVVKK